MSTLLGATFPLNSLVGKADHKHQWCFDAKAERRSVLKYGKNSRRDRFTDVDSTVRDGYVDESVPGSSPGSANGLRASSRWEYPTVPKEYHRSRVPYKNTLPMETERRGEWIQIWTKECFYMVQCD